MEYLFVVIASVASVAVLFILTKLMGNKQISQLTTFDYITGITIGSIAAEMATDLEGNPLEEVVAMVVYGLLTILISYITTKSLWGRKIFTGKPYVLLEKGKIYRDRLNKAHIDLGDFITMCRLAGYFDLDQIDTAIFEHNGNISFLPKSENRPASTNDLGIKPDKENVFVELIVDGKEIQENYKNVGKNREWLQKKLKENGYKSISEVFLLVADLQDNIRIFPMES